MKPFNLSDALNNKPVVTRDGREVTQLHLFDCDDEYPLVGVVENEIIRSSREGYYVIHNTKLRKPDNDDLFMGDEKEKAKESDEKVVLKLWAFMILNKIFEKL